MGNKKSGRSDGANVDQQEIDRLKDQLREQERTVDGHIECAKADADAARKIADILEGNGASGKRTIGWLRGYSAALNAIAGRLSNSDYIPF